MARYPSSVIYTYALDGKIGLNSYSSKDTILISNGFSTKFTLLNATGSEITEASIRVKLTLYKTSAGKDTTLCEKTIALLGSASGARESVSWPVVYTRSFTPSVTFSAQELATLSTTHYVKHKYTFYFDLIRNGYGLSGEFVMGEDFAPGNCDMNILGYIAPPVIDTRGGFTDVALYNGYTPHGRFGVFVANKSNLSTANFTVVCPDAVDYGYDVAVADSYLTIAGNTYRASNPAQYTGILTGVLGITVTESTSNVAWSFTVTDTAGGTSTNTGTIYVAPYSAPSIEVFENNRMSKDVDGRWNVSDDGTDVWTSFKARWQSIPSTTSYRNILTPEIRFGTSDDALQLSGFSTVFQSQASGYVLASYADNSSTALRAINYGGSNVVFAPEKRYKVYLSVTDWFGETASTLYEIDSAEAMFQIERSGVSVGAPLPSEATPDNPLFVCYLPAYFKGGIAEGGANVSQFTDIEHSSSASVASQGSITPSDSEFIVEKDGFMFISINVRWGRSSNQTTNMQYIYRYTALQRSEDDGANYSNEAQWYDSTGMSVLYVTYNHFCFVKKGDKFRLTFGQRLGSTGTAVTLNSWGVKAYVM